MRTITNILILLFLGVSQLLYAQEVNVEISYDTVYSGNVLAIRYSMENWQGDLVKPDFGELEIVGGPQMTSSTSYAGGRRTSSKTVIYFLKPPDNPSEYIIPEQTFRGKEQEVTTEQIKITVLDNPDGIEQKPLLKNSSPSRNFNKQYRRSEPPRGQRQRF